MPTDILIGQGLANIEGQKASFTACVSAAALATAGTDLLSIQGSATKTIRITKVIVAGTIATAAQYTSISLIKRSTAGSGGSAGTAPTITPNDSTDPAATAAVAVYTTSPTSLGTVIGIKASQRYFGPLTGTAAPVIPVVFDFGDRPARSLVLRGTAEFLFVNVGAAALGNASTWDVTVEWTEE